MRKFTLSLFACMIVAAASSAVALTNAEKIERIMAIAEKAKEPRNFYRWQSETSGNSLLAAGDYNEKLYKYFMNMVVDKAHFAGGRGVYYAEDISSSAQFIRGDGKGSLIEVRIPKGMPTIDLTKDETLSKLKRAGVSVDDVLFLDPPLAVRYSDNGWWSVKRREGVKFQPFNPEKISTSEFVQAMKVVSGSPRADEVLRPIVTARVDAEVSRNGSLLVSRPELLKFVSAKMLKSEISKSAELRSYFQEQFLSGKLNEISAQHFGVIIQAVRAAGVAIDEGPLFSKLKIAQKISYLEEVYPGHNAPEAVIDVLLKDRDLFPHMMSDHEVRTVEQHILPAITANPRLLVENKASFHLLSSENLRSIVRSDEKVRSFFSDNLSRPEFSLPVMGDLGDVLRDLRESGVAFDETAVFRRLQIKQRLSYINRFYPDGSPPTLLMKILLSKESLHNIDLWQNTQKELGKTLSRIADHDPTFLVASPDAFQYLSQNALHKALTASESVKTALREALVEGKMVDTETDALIRLSGSLAAAGAPVSEQELFKNLNIESKLEFLEKTFQKKNREVPLDFMKALLDDQTIKLNRQILPAAKIRLEFFVNEALAHHVDDAVLVEKAGRLFSYDEMKVDGRALIGFEFRTQEQQRKLDGYVSAYLRQMRASDLGSPKVRSQVFNSLVAARYRSWQTTLYERLSDWRAFDRELTPANKLILESELVAKFVNASETDAHKFGDWLQDFVKEPSAETAAALVARCQSDRYAYDNCRGRRTDSLNLFERSVVAVVEGSPDKYFERMQACLKNRGCWDFRALYLAKPPSGLSRTQVQDLLVAYKSAPEKFRVEFNDQIVTITAKYWREFPEDFKDLLHGFSPGLYPTIPRTDEIRIRRSNALVDVGSDLLKGLRAEDLGLSTELLHTYFMDSAHERDSKKPDYNRVSAIDETSRKLRRQSDDLAEHIRKSAKVVPPPELVEPDKVEPSGVEHSVVTNEHSPHVPPPADVEPPKIEAPVVAIKDSPVAPPPTSPPSKTGCATWFQKLGRFLGAIRR